METEAKNEAGPPSGQENTGEDAGGCQAAIGQQKTPDMTYTGPRPLLLTETLGELLG